MTADLPRRDSSAAEAVAFLRSPRAIRERCEAIFEQGVSGGLQHFRVDLERLPSAVELTWNVTLRAYPKLNVPLHSRANHFAFGGMQRLQRLEGLLADPRERARALTDLMVTSVLLDAGAGADFRYVEPGTGLEARRSEGLALASYHCLLRGLFSSHSDQPLRADAEALMALTPERLGSAFQVTEDNPLLGLSGRAALLTRLGRVLSTAPAEFGGQTRVGGLCDALVARARDGRLPASVVLGTVLEALGPIWPARTRLFGVDLGDVWPHPAAGGEGPTRGLVPLHKLSQWLSYSLVHPLEVAGVKVIDLDELTGLAEYRNGGLFIDTGVLALRDATASQRSHAPSSELIVEWRALTVALLDRTAVAVRAKAGLDPSEWPLGRVLEGGTWAAGRQLAAEKRSGEPPLRVHSDGTLF